MGYSSSFIGKFAFTYLALIAFGMGTAGENTKIEKIDITPAFDYLDMVKNIEQLSVTYRSEFTGALITNSDKHWMSKRITTLVLGKKIWKLDDRPDRSAWVNPHTPPLDQEQMRIPYIVNEVAGDISIYKTSTLFSLLDRRNGSMVVYSYAQDGRGDDDFKQAQFEEITEGNRSLYAIFTALRYVPVESEDSSWKIPGFWLFRDHKYVENAKKLLEKSLVIRTTDQAGNVWFCYQRVICPKPDSSMAQTWVEFKPFLELKGKYLPIRYEERKTQSSNPFSWAAIEWKMINLDLAIPQKVEYGGDSDSDMGFMRLEESKFNVTITDHDVEPDFTAAQSIEDYITKQGMN